MGEPFLTYKASGVDVEANNEANERIKAEVRRTHDERVLTRPGLFGGAMSLGRPPARGAWPRLVGAIAPVTRARPEAGTAALVRRLRRRLGPAAVPFAFLDYLAAARLDALRAAGLVGRIAGELVKRPKAVLIGGETAEMPGTFRDGRWEVVGALFGLVPEEGQAAAVAAPAAVGLAAAGEFAQPALVFSMDGVGTKTRVAVAAGRTDGLASDIIHHSLNDILCQGAAGLAMSFYLGCHRRDEAVLARLLGAVHGRCRDLGLTVLDLQVHEKPRVYRPGEIDLCAAVVGLVDAERLIQGTAVRAGDVLLGLASSGLHTNGYSLARRALLERGGYALGDRPPPLGCTLAEALLEPHRCYAASVLPLLREAGGGLKAVAHITGGGLADNLVRVLPAGLGADVRTGAWRPPPLFRLIEEAGGVPAQDGKAKGMYETFNMGIGLVLVVAAEAATEATRRLQQAGETVTEIGSVVDAPQRTGASRVRLLP